MCLKRKVRIWVGGACVAYATATQAAPFAYVTTYEHAVAVIDTATDSVVATIPAPEAQRVAVNPDGTRVYVTYALGDSLSVIDAARNELLDTVPAGPGPVAVVVHPNGRTVYVVNYTFPGTVTVIDAATNAITATITVKGPRLSSSPTVWGYPVDAAVDPQGARLYVAQSHLEPPPRPCFLPLRDLHCEMILSVVDLESNLETGWVRVGDYLASVVVHPDSRHVYVTSEAVVPGDVPDVGPVVSVIDAMYFIGVVTERVNFGGHTGNHYDKDLAIDPSGSAVYAVHPREGTVSVIDTATNTRTAVIPTGPYAHAIAVHPTGARLYVTGGVKGAGAVWVIDTATNQVVDTIGVQAPVDIAVGPENPAFTPPPTATPTQSQPPSPIATEPQPGCCDYSQSGHAGCAAIPAVVDISQCFGSGGMPRGGPDSGVFCNALTGMCEVNATATPTPTPTAPSEDTTPSLTPSNAVTPSPSPSSTPTDTVTPGGRCPGDCDGDGAVTIEDVVTLVTIALDTAPLTACEPGDANQDGAITVEEVLKAVGHALSSCGGN